MMIKLTKTEVEEICEHWLRAGDYPIEARRHTSKEMPVAIDRTYQVICTHTRGGVECSIDKLGRTSEEQ